LHSCCSTQLRLSGRFFSSGSKNNYLKKVQSKKIQSAKNNGTNILKQLPKNPRITNPRKTKEKQKKTYEKLRKTCFFIGFSLF